MSGTNPANTARSPLISPPYRAGIVGRLGGMIINKKSKIALIHIAKKDRGLDDTVYRALLQGAANIDSTKDLAFEDQFTNIMKAFKNLGFKSSRDQGKTSSRPEREDTWGCGDDLRAKIEAMWFTCAKVKTDKALRSFIKRIAKVDHTRFLLPPLAQKVAVALEAMMRSAGYDPKTGGRLPNEKRS